MATAISTYMPTKEDVFDLLVEILADGSYGKVGKLFLLAEKAGVTTDPDFIDMTGEIPVAVLEEVGIETVYEFPEIGRVALRATETLQIAKIKDIEKLKNVLTVKIKFGGLIINTTVTGD
jgi:hypothetical protein